MTRYGLTFVGCCCYQQRRIPAIAPRDDVGGQYFYPAVAQPTVQAIAHAKLLDVEKTLSNYVLVATGQKHLVVTHRGKDFGVIPTRTPIAALASFPVDDEDVVLASGEEGCVPCLTLILRRLC